jgi:uncharacterized protein YqgV (UPF0045/DUF77 family)
MSMISAQVSLYPLRTESVGPVIDEVVGILRGPGVETQMGEMSTVVWGEERAVFAALQEAFHRAAAQGDTVMVVTLSNACPERGRATCPSPQEP